MKEPSTHQNTPLYFADAAAEYREFIKKKHPEHFTQSVAQATQRKITVASLDPVAAGRPDVFVYSELLIQWRDGEKKLRRVVPVTMVVVAATKPTVSTNFAIPIQPARPFFVLEHVSKTSSRKDYQKSDDKVRGRAEGAVLPVLLPRGPGTDALRVQREGGQRRQCPPR